MAQPLPYPRRLGFLVDVDGTVALRGDRSPYDETRVGEDAPNRPVIVVVQALIRHGLNPLYVSGRSMGCAQATSAWLMHHIGTPNGEEMRIFMRDVGDKRPDHVVKAELFDKRIAPYYNVVISLDDRDQVVRMWRTKGLTCLQVAEGAF